MMIAATICVLLALGVLVNIEVWRRRVSAACAVDERRRARRERAWEAVRDLEGRSERRAA